MNRVCVATGVQEYQIIFGFDNVTVGFVYIFLPRMTLDNWTFKLFLVRIPLLWDNQDKSLISTFFFSLSNIGSRRTFVTSFVFLAHRKPVKYLGEEKQIQMRLENNRILMLMHHFVLAY